MSTPVSTCYFCIRRIVCNKNTGQSNSRDLYAVELGTLTEHQAEQVFQAVARFIRIIDTKPEMGCSIIVDEPRLLQVLECHFEETCKSDITEYVLQFERELDTITATACDVLSKSFLENHDQAAWKQFDSSRDDRPGNAHILAIAVRAAECIRQKTTSAGYLTSASSMASESTQKRKGKGRLTPLIIFWGDVTRSLLDNQQHPNPSQEIFFADIRKQWYSFLFHPNGKNDDPSDIPLMTDLGSVSGDAVPSKTPESIQNGIGGGGPAPPGIWKDFQQCYFDYWCKYVVKESLAANNEQRNSLPAMPANLNDALTTFEKVNIYNSAGEDVAVSTGGTHSEVVPEPKNNQPTLADSNNVDPSALPESARKSRGKGRPPSPKSPWVIKQYFDEGKKPAAIRELWNSLPYAERKKIDPDNPHPYGDKPEEKENALKEICNIIKAEKRRRKKEDKKS